MPIPQSHPRNAPSPHWCAGRKGTEAHKAWLWKVLNDDPTCPSRLVLHTMAETQEPIAVTLRHINRVRKAWGSIVGKGVHGASSVKKKAEPLGQLVRVTPSLAFVGVHVFAAWLQQHERMSMVRPALQQAMHRYHSQHPDDDFPCCIPASRRSVVASKRSFCAAVGD